WIKNSHHPSLKNTKPIKNYKMLLLNNIRANEKDLRWPLHRT
ncbi:hypothetical protein DOY81_005713, partial [Sarcophaga bullata]